MRSNVKLLLLTIMLILVAGNQVIMSETTNKYFQGLNSGNSFSTNQEIFDLSNDMELKQVVGENMRIVQCLQHNQEIIIYYSMIQSYPNVSQGYGVLITDGSRKTDVSVSHQMDYSNGIAIDNGNLYITHKDGITVYSLADTRISKEIAIPDVRSQPVVTGGMLYFHNGKVLFSYDLARNEVSKQLSIEPIASLPANDSAIQSMINSRMSFVGNKMVISGDYFEKNSHGRSIVACVDLNTLTLLWQKQFDLGLWDQYLKIFGEKLYFYGSSPTNDYSKNGFYCLDLGSGSTIWMQNRCGTRGDNDDAGCSPDGDGFLQFAVNNDYLVTEHRGLKVLSANNGQLLNNFKSPYIFMPSNELYLENNKVWCLSYINENGDYNKYFLCFDINKGEYLSKISINKMLNQYDFLKNDGVLVDLIPYFVPNGLLIEIHYVDNLNILPTRIQSDILLFKSKNTPPSVITKLTVSPEQIIVEVSKSAQFTTKAYINGVPASPREITWSVEPDYLGMIDDYGNFTARVAGQGFIKARVSDPPLEAVSMILVTNPNNQNPDPKEKPLPPKNLGLVYDNNAKSVMLSWDIPQNSQTNEIIKYNIYKSSTQNAFNLAAVVDGSGGNSFTDNNVSKGNTYQYYVTAINDIGESMASDTVTIQIPIDKGNNKVPKKPLYFNATYDPINNAVSMFWQKPDESGTYISYRICRYKLSDNSYEILISFASSLDQVSWSHNNPSKGKWYYCVQAFNEFGESPPSDPILVEIN